MKEKVLRDTQTRSIHEMGKMKRAQELRVDEFSVQKLRESHETIRRLTSQLQDSGEFQEVESNYSVRLSYVPSQSAAIPSSRSMLTCDKRWPFDTWNAPGLQENFFINQFSIFGSLRNPSQGIHYCATPRKTESVAQAVETGTFRKR